MKPTIPIHDRRFEYIPARDHDAGSDKFKERQMARMKAAQAASNVKAIKARKVSA